jgi:hypothetical protein
VETGEEGMKCKECGRKVVNDGSYYKHSDGRVHHDPVIEMEVVDMAPRTRVVPQDGSPYTPTLDDSNPEDASLMETGSDLVPEAMEIFEELDPVLGDVEPASLPDEAKASAELSEAEVVETVKPSAKPTFGVPTKDKFITVRGGGQYLKARDRIVWLRGEPDQHPDWTIDTIPEEVIRGEYKNKTTVNGGYARIRCNIYDETGRLIASGTKTEFSERFMDFVEKAETGAIARALAVAGYGTEAAIDLDEGLDADRIADAPVSGRPITISASAVEGLVQGGRSENATTAQLNEIERLAVQTEIGPNIVPLIENVCKVKVPDLTDNPGEVIRDFLESLSFEQAADLIKALGKVKDE